MARWYCSGSRCMSVSRPILSWSVLGIARDKTFFRDCTLSYRSETSSSFCKSLSVDESWSEMVVRGLEPLFRSHSLVMQVYSAAAFSQIFCWMSLT